MKKRRRTGRYVLLFLLLIGISILLFFEQGNYVFAETTSFGNDGSIKDPIERSYNLPVTYESVSSSKAPNAESRLDIPTYRSKDCHDAVHPDVVDFGNGSSWNGYRYWMAMTPYPGSNNRYENPSIIVSNDRINWTEPSGIQNPIDSARSPRYHSDTDLVYEPDLDRMVCYWRNVNGTKTTAYYSYSKNGINWTSGYECYEGPCLSPSVIRFSNNYYQIYVIYKGNLIRYTSTQPMASLWNDTDPVICNMSWLPANSGIWHAKVRYDIEHRMYITIFMMVKKGTTNPTGPLYLAYSIDGENFRVQQEPTLMDKNSKSWDRDFIYRSTFWLCEDTMHIWYSARGGGCGGTWGIGYTSSKLIWNSTISRDIISRYKSKMLNVTQPKRFFSDPISNQSTIHTDDGIFGSWNSSSGNDKLPSVVKNNTVDINDTSPGARDQMIADNVSRNVSSNVIDAKGGQILPGVIRKAYQTSANFSGNGNYTILPEGPGSSDNDDNRSYPLNVTTDDKNGYQNRTDLPIDPVVKYDILLGPFTFVNGDPVVGIIVVLNYNSNDLISVTNEQGYIFLSGISPGEYRGTTYYHDEEHNFNITLMEDGSLIQDLPALEIDDNEGLENHTNPWFGTLVVLMLISIFLFGAVIIINRV